MTATLHIPARRAGASDATVTIPHVQQLPWAQRWTPCKDDPDVWFADKTGGMDTRRAKWRCRTECPVMAQCRAHAIAAGEGIGVWGGLTGKELTAERRARGLAR